MGWLSNIIKEFRIDYLESELDRGIEWDMHCGKLTGAMALEKRDIYQAELDELKKEKK